MAERISRRLVLLSSAAIGAVYAAGYLGTRAADASLGATPVAGTGTSASSTATAASAAIDAVAAGQPPTVGASAGSAVTTAPVATATRKTTAARITTSQHPSSPPVQQTPPATPRSPTVAKPIPGASAPPPAAVVTAQRVEQPAPSAITQVAVKTAPKPAATTAPVPRVVAAVPDRVTATPTIVRFTAKPTATSAPASSGYRDGTYTALGTSRRGDIQVALTIKAGRIANVAITDATTQYPVSWIAPLRGEVVARQNARVDLVSGATFSSLAFQGAVQRALTQATA